MKPTFTALAAICCMAAFAAIDVITLGYGETVDVSRPAKVVAVECFSNPADGTYNPKRETLIFGTELDITQFATTNFTYSVVTTNTLGVATTNVLEVPHPMPLPDIATAYWTNTLVTSWATTNVVPVLTKAFTNDIEAASYLAPGDTIFTPATDTFRGKLNIYIED